MQDIAKVTNDFINLSFGIFIVILILSTYIMQKSLKEMRQRLMAEGEVYRYQNHLEELVEKRTNEFKNAMTKVKTLSGLLPICASYKKFVTTTDTGTKLSRISGNTQGQSSVTGSARNVQKNSNQNYIGTRSRLNRST